MTPRELRYPNRRIGRKVLWFEQVESTNSVAAQHAADPSQDGLVIVADAQVAGRGRMGRTWQSPPGEGLLLSVLLFPPETARRPAALTALASVAVCETIYHCAGLPATIKWPNDVLVRGRKVCGILVECGQGCVIGIGLNVHTSADSFAAAQLPQAGSLAMFPDHPLDREAILRTALRRLDDYYDDLLQGRVGDLESRWRWHSGLLGRPVMVHTQGQQFAGRLLELNLTDVVLRDTEGTVRHLAPEAIEHIVPMIA